MKYSAGKPTWIFSLMIDFLLSGLVIWFIVEIYRFKQQYITRKPASEIANKVISILILIIISFMIKTIYLIG